MEDIYSSAGVVALNECLQEKLNSPAKKKTGQVERLPSDIKEFAWYLVYYKRPEFIPVYQIYTPRGRSLCGYKGENIGDCKGFNERVLSKCHYDK